MNPSGTRACSVAASLFLTMLLICPAPAALIVYTACDPGAGPSDPCPNSESEQAAWTTAACACGTVRTIDFENQALGNFSSRTPIANVTISLVNADPTGGIATALYEPTATGYNTTAGGANFLRFVPGSGTAPSQVLFSFDTPINAFGLHITGMGTAVDNLHIVFSSGGIGGINLTGDQAGGNQYVGLIFCDKPVSSIALRFDSAAPPFDIIGIDDVSISAAVTPEPATALLLILGAIALRRRL
jgi:hypothetical protein